MQLSFGKLQIPIFLAVRASCDETSVRNFERAHTFNNRVCKTVAYRIHSIFIKTIRVRIFRKHPSKLTIKTLRFRAMRNLQRARSAKFPAQLATSAEREVPRATCNERGARSSPRNLQRARSAKFPAQKSRVSPVQEKYCERFSSPKFGGAISGDAFYTSSLIKTNTVNQNIFFIVRPCTMTKCSEKSLSKTITSLS